MKFTLKRQLGTNEIAENHQAIAASIAGRRPGVRAAHG